MLLRHQIFLGLYLSLVGLSVWYFNYLTYHSERDELWLQLEQLLAEVTLPIKIARLYEEPPRTDLPVPVYGIAVNELADTWAAVRSEGRSHEGIDVFAARGTPVFAATPGYVLRAGENERGGTIVFTVGPGGHRYYYAHLERFAAGLYRGMPITEDTVLGYVGNTGNASNTPPHLHFGIYTEFGPINPYPLLTAEE